MGVVHRLLDGDDDDDDERGATTTLAEMLRHVGDQRVPPHYPLRGLTQALPSLRRSIELESEDALRMAREAGL